MEFRDLDPRSIREQVNAAQIFEPWLAAWHERKRSFTGAMGFEERSGRDYLYRRKDRRSSSLGPRSPETEAMLEAFLRGRDENKARLASLSEEMTRQAAIVRALGASGIPQAAARVLRRVAQEAPELGLRVIGTNALYGYAAMAGVSLSADSLATNDMDLLFDDRKRLRIIGEDKESVGFLHLLKGIDQSYRMAGKRQYRATNAAGYMIEFIRPEPRPNWKEMPGARAASDEEIEPVPVRGLQWLVNCPAVDAVVIDERGFAAPMRAPDPRVWAAHKLWLSEEEDREPAKKVRDRLQGRLVLGLVLEKLPQFPLDEDFLGTLPGALRKAIPEYLLQAPVRPEGEGGTEPDW